MTQPCKNTHRMTLPLGYVNTSEVFNIFPSLIKLSIAFYTTPIISSTLFTLLSPFKTCNLELVSQTRFAIILSHRLQGLFKTGFTNLHCLQIANKFGTTTDISQNIYFSRKCNVSSNSAEKKVRFQKESSMSTATLLKR